MNCVQCICDMILDAVPNAGDHRPDRIDHAGDKAGDRIPDCRNDIVNGVHHRADRCVNGVPNDSDNSFNEIDFLRYTVVNCRPDTDKKVLDACPDSCEKVLLIH